MNMLRPRRKRLVLVVMSEVERLSREDRQSASPALHRARVDEGFHARPGQPSASAGGLIDRCVLRSGDSRARLVSCRPDIGVEGQALERIAFGEESCWSEGEVATECHDCGVEGGSFHHFRCDMEQCPVCHAQLLSCEHGPPV